MNEMKGLGPATALLLAVASGCLQDVTIRPAADSVTTADAGAELGQVLELTRVGAFDFADEQSHERPEYVTSVHYVASGRFDADDATDVVWNQLDGEANAFYFGFGSSSRGLRLSFDACDGESCIIAGAKTPWAKFELAVGDFDGDGSSDLLWLPRSEHLGELGFDLYASFNAPGGMSLALVRQTLPLGEPTGAAVDAEAAVTPVNMHVADLNGDGRDDLLFVFAYEAEPAQGAGATVWRIDYQALLAEDDLPPFEAQARALAFEYPVPGSAVPTVSSAVVDLDQDRSMDLLWSLHVAAEADAGAAMQIWSTWTHNRPMIEDDDLAYEPADPVRALVLPLPADVPPILLHGDFDGDRLKDLAWVSAKSRELIVHWASFQSDRFEPPRRVSIALPPPTTTALDGTEGTLASVVDVDEDGRDDVLVNLRQGNGVNRLVISRGGNSGPGAMPLVADHPAEGSWSGVRTLLGDFDGDGRSDVLWSHTTTRSVVNVAYGALP
jgi:hypothetical protein